MDDLNKIVTWVGKTKGIHYRPHRVTPGKHVVIKIYRKIAKLSQKETRDILADYLSALGLKPGKGIIRGSIKWVAIIDRAKFENKMKGKVEGKVSNKELLKALKKVQQKSKAKAKTKVAATAKVQQKQKQYWPTWQKATLEPEQQKQKQYQKVYLSMSRRSPLRALIAEARSLL
jgi:hypothetical protein